MSVVDSCPDENVLLQAAAYRMPLVIGVTGHRDLIPGDCETLRKSVKKVFDDLKAKYASTPLLVLTPLAEGADRLVAEVALESGADLVAPLPMKQELYEEDFRPAGTTTGTVSESQHAFRALLSKTKRHFEMPLIPGFTWEQVAVNADAARDLQYLLVGLYVARHCQILISLWDERTSGSTGGTWQVVTYKLTGHVFNLAAAQLAALEKLEPPFGHRQTILEEPEMGPVHHIRARRQKTTPLEAPLNSEPRYERLAPGTSKVRKLAEAGEKRLPGEEPPTPLGKLRRTPKPRWQIPFWRFFWAIVDFADWLVRRVQRVIAFMLPSRPPATPEQLYFKGVARVYENIDAFNGHVAALSEKDGWVGNREYLLPQQEWPAPSGPLTRGHVAALQRLGNAYAVADKLAGQFQQRIQWTLKLLILLVLVAVVLFGVYAHLGGAAWQLWCLAGYIVVLASADFYYLWAKHEDQQNKYQDYRTVAEGLRVQFYWRLAGMTESAAEHYLSKQRSELDWIRHAVQAWGVLTPASPTPQGQSVTRYWIKHVEQTEKGPVYHGQAYYYGRTAGPRDLNYSILYKELGSGFLVASLALAAAAAFFGKNWAFTDYIYYSLPIAPALYLALPVALLIGICHLGFKLRELTKEPRYEREELTLHLRYGIAGLIFAAILLFLLLAVRELLLWLTGIHLPETAHEDHAWKTHIQDWLIVGMATFALITALMHTFKERRGFAEHHKQYKRMAAVFERAKTRLDQLGQSNNPTAAQRVLTDLGHEALAEHGDWLLLHRERPMEMPKVEL